MELRKRLKMSSLVLGAAITGILAGSVTMTGCGKSGTEANGCGGPNGCGGQNGCNGPNGCNGQHAKGAESRKAEMPKK